MATPFQMTLIPGGKAPTIKPGWHKRALAAERRHKPTTAPQKGDPRADAKAVDYARWLAARDGIEIPTDAAETRVDWQPTQHGYRPRAVTWHSAPRRYHPAARGMAQPAVAPLLTIELPHWDYEAPAVIESALPEWAAPVVIETTAPTLKPLKSPFHSEAETHLEPMALCPAVGMPCKVDCGFRSGCGRPHPVEGIDTLISAATIASPDLNADSVDPVEAIEAEPLEPLCASDDDWRADESTHPVIALCLSDKAQAALFDRLQDGTFPADGRRAKGGAWRLTVADAEECAGLASVRFVGPPRKAYTRRAALAPVVTIPVPPEAIRTVPAAAFIPGATAPGPIVYHAAPRL